MDKEHKMSNGQGLAITAAIILMAACSGDPEQVAAGEVAVFGNDPALKQRAMVWLTSLHWQEANAVVSGVREANAAAKAASNPIGANVPGKAVSN